MSLNCPSQGPLVITNSSISIAANEYAYCGNITSLVITSTIIYIGIYIYLSLTIRIFVIA